MKVITFTTILIFVFLSSSGQTIERKGFYFSIGFGPSMTNYKIDGEFSKPAASTIFYGSNLLLDVNSDNFSGNIEELPFSKTSFGLRTNFNLGYGITNQIVLSYMNRVSFILDDILSRTNYISHYDSPPALTIAGLTGIEIDYYFSENIKSPYLSVGGGISVWNQPFVYDYLTKTGLGLSIGGGYQISKHICIDINMFYMKGNLRKKIKNEIENLGNNVHINGSVNAISFGLDLKYVLF